jgi:LysR family transcriptional regulator, benzoate and cis,cis-muconate-responsive activator of ben and cat genes
MELWQLRYFLAVADELHYGRAALQLNVAQPSVTRAVQTLERELGAALLERDKRRVVLTAAGRVFADAAREALAALEAAARLTQRTARGDAGRLVIGFEGSSAFGFIPRTMEAFLASQRDVSFELLEMSTADQVSALRQRRIELGFVVPPIVDSGIAVERLGKEPVVVAMPADHALMKNRAVARWELAKEPLILPAAGTACGTTLAIQAACDGRLPPAITHVNDAQLQLNFIVAGFGLALVPLSAVAFPQPQLGWRPLCPALHIDIAVAHLADVGLTTLAGRFIAAARAQAQAQNPDAEADTLVRCSHKA